MDWVKDTCAVTNMVFDRPTNLFAWVTKDGRAYAVKRPIVSYFDDCKTNYQLNEYKKGQKYWNGWIFHDNPNDRAVQVCINGRFSLLAVACERCM
jgi:hypothetical protein